MIDKLRLGLGMVYVKKHYAEGYLVVAICDAELLGETLIDEGRGIKFYIDPNFYKGDLLSVDRAIRELSKADIANLVGRRIVGRALEEGLIHRDAIIEINGVPHAQLLVLRR